MIACCSLITSVLLSWDVAIMFWYCAAYQFQLTWNVVMFRTILPFGFNMFC